MSSFIRRILGATQKYTVMDFAFLKITLVSLGIILGAYFSQFFLGNASLLWVIFVFTYLWIIYRTFMEHLK